MFVCAYMRAVHVCGGGHGPAASCTALPASVPQSLWFPVPSSAPHHNTQQVCMCQWHTPSNKALSEPALSAGCQLHNLLDSYENLEAAPRPELCWRQSGVVRHWAD